MDVINVCSKLTKRTSSYYVHISAHSRTFAFTIKDHNFLLPPLSYNTNVNRGNQCTISNNMLLNEIENLVIKDLINQHVSDF